VGERVRVAQLAWGTDCKLLREPVHLVFGADVVYSEDGFVPMVGTLRAAVGRGAVGLLCYRRRCAVTSEEHFFHLLTDAMDVERLEASLEVALGAALYRLTPRSRRAASSTQPCQYCEFLRAQWARHFVSEHAPAGAAGSPGAGWTPSDLLL